MHVEQGLDMLVHPLCGAGGRVQQPVRFVEPERDPIVQQQAVVTEHDAIAATARLQTGKVIHVQQIEQRRYARALEHELAQGGSINHPNGIAHGQGRTLGSLLPGLARLWVITRPLPAHAGVHHHCAMCQVPIGQRCVAPRKHLRPRARTRDGTELHWYKRRPEGCRTDSSRCDAGHRPHHANHIQVASLALVHAHAGGGVAFDQLDRIETLTDRQPQVGGSHVTRKIDEHLVTTLTLRNRPQRCPYAARVIERHGQHDRSVAAAPRRDGSSARTPTVFEAAGQGEHPIGGTRKLQVARCRNRHKALHHIAPDDARQPALGSQVNRRIPAAGTGEQIAVQPTRPPRRVDHFHRFDTPATKGFSHLRANVA